MKAKVLKFVGVCLVCLGVIFGLAVLIEHLN